MTTSCSIRHFVQTAFMTTFKNEWHDALRSQRFFRRQSTTTRSECSRYSLHIGKYNNIIKRSWKLIIVKGPSETWPQNTFCARQFLSHNSIHTGIAKTVCYTHWNLEIGPCRIVVSVRINWRVLCKSRMGPIF